MPPEPAGASTNAPDHWAPRNLGGSESVWSAGSGGIWSVEVCHRGFANAQYGFVHKMLQVLLLPNSWSVLKISLFVWYIGDFHA